MKLLLTLLILSLPLGAQTSTKYVKVDEKLYQLIYMPMVPRQYIDYTLPSDESVSVKVVELNRTPVRVWSPTVDTWSLGFITVLRTLTSEEIVREILDE